MITIIRLLFLKPMTGQSFKVKVLQGIAATYPEPEDKEEFVKSKLYDYSYSSSVLPVKYSWPQNAIN
uniref:NADP-dependent malic enzyme-like isoform X1 n=1 Tax=Bemisia tabaci TaxID=7038 RepID=A0A7S5LK67_BEMTA|nr:NADP-dependent malic enzyme-like isoform X1 [Bemisia tabaci]